MNFQRSTTQVVSVSAWPLLLILIACAVLFSSTAGGQSSRIRLPDFGDSSSSVLTRSDEARLGEAFLREILASKDLLRDAEVQAYVNDVGFKLVEASEAGSTPFRFVVFDDPLINAFAGPTGVIGVNSGLLLAARNESEFAAVVAHEIAHVTQRHLARAFELDDRNSIATMAGVLAALVLASQSSEAGQAALATVIGSRTQSQLDFTRANEVEADAIGIEILAAAGFDPRAMATFFEQLQTSHRYIRLPPEFLSTHPVTTSRIGESRGRAEQYPYKQYEDSPEFAFARAKLRVLTEGASKSLDAFTRELSQGAGTHKGAVRYGQGLALIGLKRWQEAEPVLSELLKRYPKAHSVLDAYSTVLFNLGEVGRAEKLLRDRLDVYLFDRVLTLALGRLLIDDSRAGEAVVLMNAYIQREAQDASAYELLAKAYDRRGETAASFAALAENRYYTGRLLLAIQHLEQAQRTGGGDYYLGSRIDARLETMRNEHTSRVARRN